MDPLQPSSVTPQSGSIRIKQELNFEEFEEPLDFGDSDENEDEEEESNSLSIPEHCSNITIKDELPVNVKREMVHIKRETYQEVNSLGNLTEEQTETSSRNVNNKKQGIANLSKTELLRQKVECPICSKLILPRGLNAHMYHHRKPAPYSCTQCFKKFTRKSVYNNHLFKLHFDEWKKKFQFGDRLPDLSNVNKSPKMGQFLIRRDKNQRKKKHICCICKKNYITLWQLQVHERKVHGKNMFECDYCKEQLSNRRNLVAHVKMHFDQMPQSCPICSKDCDNSSSLSAHLRKHKNRGSFMCTICDTNFQNSELLTKHYSVKHRITFITCRYCDQSFNDSISYAAHVRIHKSEKTFRCSECSKIFHFKAALAAHLKYIHKTIQKDSSALNENSIDRSVKLFSCRHCKKSFEKLIDYANHLKSHKEVVPRCNDCYRKFKNKFELLKHLKDIHKKYKNSGIVITNDAA